MGIEALEGLYLTYTVYLLVFVGTELAGCFNNNNINDDNSPHCFVKLILKMGCQLSMHKVDTKL